MHVPGRRGDEKKMTGVSIECVDKRKWETFTMMSLLSQ